MTEKKLKGVRSNLVAVLVVAAFMAWGWWMVWEATGTDEMTLPPCPTEDSDNCYWDAEKQGNGQGQSFYVIDGEVTYVD